MARGKGTANLAASIEPLAGAPLDARDIVPTVADLYIASNWPYKYIGMKTTVTATGETYRLVNMDVTQESSWVLDGVGSFDDLSNRPVKDVTDIDDIVTPLPTPKMYGFEYRQPGKKIYFYVDSDNGSDTNDGKTTTTAFRTIQHAINQLPPWKYYAEDSVNTSYQGEIRVNTSASTPYEVFTANACIVAVLAWDFTNDVVNDANGSLTITTSTANNCISAEYAQLTIYVKNLTLTNTKTNGNGLYASRNAIVTIFRNNDSVTHNLTITSAGIGIYALMSAYIELQGSVAYDCQLTVTSVSQCVRAEKHSYIGIAFNASLTSSGNVAVYENMFGVITLSGNGATEQKKCLIEINGASTAYVIRILNMSEFHCSVPNSSIRIICTHTTTANPIIEAAGGSVINLTSSYELNVETKSSSGLCLRSLQGSSIILTFGTDANKNYLKGNSSSSSWNVYSTQISKILFMGGSANVSPVITGKNGLGSYAGSVIAYDNIKNDATTGTGTGSGGRILTGQQTSIPNY